MAVASANSVLWHLSVILVQYNSHRMLLYSMPTDRANIAENNVPTGTDVLGDLKSMLEAYGNLCLVKVASTDD